MMDIGYRIYQAERTLSVAEQRAVDAANGELIASLARLWHGAAERFHAPRGSRPTATAMLEKPTCLQLSAWTPRWLSPALTCWSANRSVRDEQGTG